MLSLVHYLCACAMEFLEIDLSSVLELELHMPANNTCSCFVLLYNYRSISANCGVICMFQWTGLAGCFAGHTVTKMVKCRVLLLDGTEFACDVNVSACFVLLYVKFCELVSNSCRLMDICYSYLISINIYIYMVMQSCMMSGIVRKWHF